MFFDAVERFFGWKAPTEPVADMIYHPRETHESINLCLVKVMISGLETTTHHTIHRSYLQAFCDGAADDDGVKVVTVYQEVFHHRHPDPDQPVEPAALIPAIGSTFAMLRSKTV